MKLAIIRSDRYHWIMAPIRLGEMSCRFALIAAGYFGPPNWGVLTISWYRLLSNFPPTLQPYKEHHINQEANKINLLKRLWQEEDGQGLVEFTLVVVLVVLVFWMGARNTDIGGSLAKGWTKVMDCVISPFSCSA